MPVQTFFKRHRPDQVIDIVGLRILDQSANLQGPGAGVEVTDVFVDVLEGFCETKLECRLFTDEGELISYDGSHVTKVGASIYGRLLASSIGD